MALLSRSCSTPGPVSTGIGNHVWVQLRSRKFTSVCNQLLMSTQPGHPFVGRRSEYCALNIGSDLLATAREENGEFCVTIGPVIRTGILA